MRIVYGQVRVFDIKVGLNQDSPLSSFLLILILDILSNFLKEGIPWKLLFADDLLIVTESEKKLQKNWERSMKKHIAKCSMITMEGTDQCDKSQKHV